MPIPAWSRNKSDETLDLSPFKALLLRTCGHTFDKEREHSLMAALCRRMAALSLHHYDSYYSQLLHDQEELLRLTELLTINETYFFREPEHLNLIIDTLLPEFLATRGKGPIRILSAGCSTGEEPYSLAILLRERFGAESEELFLLNGVDIDSTVIAAAKAGLYGKNSFRSIDPILLERYFEPCAHGRFQVREVIKKQVGFAVVNLLDTSYPARMQMPDIILYRNVSIYFPRQVQREIFGRLAELLSVDGSLLVGAAETIHHDLGILSLVKHDSLFFYRKRPQLPTLTFPERRRSSRIFPPAGEQRGSVSLPVGDAVRLPVLQNRPLTGAIPEDYHSRPTPLKVSERFAAAMALAHNKEDDKALAVLDTIIDQESTFVPAFSFKGRLLLKLSRFNDAEKVCHDILRCDSLSPDPYLLLGIIARQRGDDVVASKRFREAIYLDASCWLAHFYSAEIFFAQQEMKRGRSSYEATLRILGNGSLAKHGDDYFPLAVNAEQFMVICRHKLSLLKETR